MRYFPLIWGIPLAACGIAFGFANSVFYFPLCIFLFLITVNHCALTLLRGRDIFRTVLFIAVVAYAAGLYWIVVPVHYYGHMPWALAVPAAFFISLYVAVYAAVYALGLYFFRTRIPFLVLGIFAGTLWASLECLRQWIFGGFPWLSLGSAFAGWPQTIQAAQWVGEVGISASIACMALWLTRPGPRTVAAAVILGSLLLFPGFLQGELQIKDPVSSLLVQGNIDQNKKWSKNFKQNTLDKYKRLTLSGCGKDIPDVVIWPETAMPFYVQEVNSESRELRKFVLEKDIRLIVGAPGYEMLENGEGDYRLFNRAFLFNAKGKIQDTYDKMHLVPFGEYVPFKSLFPFIGKLTHGVKDFSPGGGHSPLQSGTLALGTFICYETIFSHEVQRKVEAGANLLVNISNDAWFGETSAPYQHLYMAVMRAVEQHRFLLRATNTGISAFISPSGEVMKKSDIFTDATLRGEVSLLQKRTFFSKHFNFVHLFWFLLLGGFFIHRLKGKNAKKTVNGR